MAGERLAKVIARAGMCSRREAEQWIAAGRVSVNGALIRSPAFNVTARDKVEVDGGELAARRATRVWLYHKPAGLVVTEKDPEGRPTIFADLATKGLPRVLSIGRLDINTEGLLLLTNDGGLKRVLELPETGWLRRYRVRAHGSIKQDRLDALKKGMEIDGVKYGSIDAKIEREQGSNVWLLVALREGKNREIKNVLGALGLTVNRLIRTSFGPFQLGDLKPGELDTVPARVLQDQLGKKLAEAAGADFDAPLPEPLPDRTPDRKPRPEGRGTRTPRHEDKRQGRPGPGRGSGRRDDRRGFEKPAPSSRILFDDGRPPEPFEPERLDELRKARKAGRDGPPERGNKPDRNAKGDRGSRPDRGGKPFGDRKPGGKPGGKRFGDDRPRSDKSRSGKPSGGKPRGDRPQSRKDGPLGRPARGRPPRRNG